MKFTIFLRKVILNFLKIKKVSFNYETVREFSIITEKTVSLNRRNISDIQSKKKFLYIKESFVKSKRVSLI